jgi:hypothetical protein
VKSRYASSLASRGGATPRSQPHDPDGNPDTSFLAKIPADLPFTFQTLDKRGMVLNMAQTWHQVRPGEIRNDCGGCHSHSQKPTDFKLTAAARPEYQPFDLTKDETGLRFEKGVKNVEYYRDIKPILNRSCVACHTRSIEKPAGNLVLDDDALMQGPDSLGGLVSGPSGKVPGTYFRLALDHAGRFGHKSPVGDWAHPQASRYVRLFQARRSLLAWKVHGERLDGWSNDDFAHETIPGDPGSMRYKGQPFAKKPESRRLVNLAYTGSIMPPPDAVKAGKVAPLGDEDRRTLVRWIDLGCPIDLDYEAAQPTARGNGWLQDDSRPTLTLTAPLSGANVALTRILVGMHDYDSGLDIESFRVVADFAVDDVPAGENLAAKFKPASAGVWELKLAQPIRKLERGTLAVSVEDRQGNRTEVVRRFSVK